MQGCSTNPSQELAMDLEDESARRADWNYLLRSGIHDSIADRGDAVVVRNYVRTSFSNHHVAMWEGPRTGRRMTVVWSNDGGRYIRGLTDEEDYAYDSMISSSSSSSSRGDPENERPWSKLPQHLLELVIQRLSLFEAIMFRSTCRGWDATGRRYGMSTFYPLLLAAADDAGGGYRHFLSVTDRMQFLVKMERRATAVAACRGWLITAKLSGRALALVSPFSGQRAELPPWTRQGRNLFSIAMSAAPHPATDCVVLAIDERSAFFCRPRGGEWTEIACELREGNGDRMHLHQAVSHGGKFWAVTRWLSLVEIDVARRRMTPLERTRSSIFHDGSTAMAATAESFVPYLVPCGESIWLLVAIFREREGSSDEVDCFEVFRLDPASMAWVKMGDLEGQVAFVGRECSVMVRRPQAGERGNLIYCACWSGAAAWRVFDMEKGTMRAGPKMRGPAAHQKRLWIQPFLEKVPRSA